MTATVRRRHPPRPWLAAAAGGLVLVIAATVWHLTLGAVQVPASEVIGALTGHASTPGEMIVVDIRLPRVLVALAVGAALAAAGVVMQGVTGNPLAAPDLLGVTAGASFAVVLTLTVVPRLAEVSTVALALCGAAAAGCAVLALAGRSKGSGLRENRLILGGVTVSALLLSLTQGLIIFHENNAESVVYWLVGGVNLSQWREAWTILPVALAGIAGCLAMASRLNVLALGEEMARSLGQRVALVRLCGAALVILISGACVAVAGPIGFVGLVVPHMARRLVGSDHVRLLPVSALFGGALLVLADAVSHFVNPPNEVPAGVVTALLGAPYFVWLARRDRKSA
ncbi:FecCD family ABC transporter permease [Microtetraspora malaysiensis]|uniref:FecCD family ABC transporter permease n=1 Tax=Microtetraspora malaysiensis TaxID=161358 RepID=UPI003D8CDCC7